VGGFNDNGKNLFQWCIALDDHHVGTRDHDVPDPQFGNLQHPLHHGECIGIQQGAAFGVPEQLYQLVSVFRFVAEGP